MSKITIYHNARCSKSRCALGILEDRHIDYQVREYLKDTPSAEELKSILKKLDMKAEELVRKNEAVFKAQFKDKTFTEDEWIAIMVENPKLIQRPIVIKGDKAVIARPTEKMDELL